MAGNKNSGRKPMYLTVKKFDEFVLNHFAHLKTEVRLHTWLLMVIAIAVIGKLVIDFLWG